MSTRTQIWTTVIGASAALVQIAIHFVVTYGPTIATLVTQNIGLLVAGGIATAVVAYFGAPK